MKPTTMMIALLALAGAASLPGCAEMAAQQQAADQSRCAGYGFQPGTNQFANCMMRTQQQRTADFNASLQQSNENRQREADRQALKDAAASIGGSSKPQPKEEMDGFIPKSAEQGFTPQTSSGNTTCTSTTTSQQTDNAGTSTTTTECH